MNLPRLYTTVVIGKTGKVFDLAVAYPGPKDQPPQNAFTCPKEEVEELRKKKGNK